jgi:hypothetical protein
MQKLEYQLEDDLTGGPADETVRFDLDGITYEIDLTAKNAASFRRRLAPFVERARRASHRRPRTRTAASRARSHQIRIWAASQGLEVSDRGRLRAEIVQEYERAQADAGPRRGRQAENGRRASGRRAKGTAPADNSSSSRRKASRQQN